MPPDCAVCASGYTGAQGDVCYECGEVTAVASEVAAVIFVFLIPCLLFYTYKYLTTVTQDSPERLVRIQGYLAHIKRAIPLQSLKILLVTWQIITQVSHVTLATSTLMPGPCA